MLSHISMGDCFMFRKRNIGAVAGMACALLLAWTPNSYANWTGSLSGASPGYESSRWQDESYSEVRFKNCSGTNYVVVALYEDNALSPDTNHGQKKFTNCFTGYDAVSAGEWTGLPLDGYYFKLADTNRSFLNVRVFAIDTTKAD
ncbi:hypothetical protein AB0D56_36325 [Streptomyces sp. NPDC048209]|uniref:hypothetical protein n=1 Tax=Streptomyces TaxID=1883 RepID=UPI003428515F